MVSISLKGEDYTMTRMSKQMQRRHICPRKRSYPLHEKTGKKKDNLKDGYKPHINAISVEKISMFIPKIK